MTAQPSRAHRFRLGCVFFAALALVAPQAYGQGRDPLVNGTLIGAAVGAGAGVVLTHAVRDSELGATQYAYGALIFGGIGAGIGLGVDALLNRAIPGPGVTPGRVFITPTVWRDVAGVVVKLRW